jgi:hypothetical protein
MSARSRILAAVAVAAALLVLVAWFAATGERAAPAVRTAGPAASAASGDVALATPGGLDSGRSAHAAAGTAPNV